MMVSQARSLIGSRELGRANLTSLILNFSLNLRLSLGLSLHHSGPVWTILGIQATGKKKEYSHRSDMVKTTQRSKSWYDPVTSKNQPCDKALIRILSSMGLCIISISSSLLASNSDHAFLHSKKETTVNGFHRGID